MTRREFWATNASAITVGNEPLIVDLLVNRTGSGNEERMLLRHLQLLATLTLQFPGVQGVPPITGLFLCPPATPIESLADAIAGYSRLARPIALPLNDPYTSVAIIGAGPATAITLTLAPGGEIPVPNGWILRAIVNCAAGTAVPGPGLGSTGILNAVLEIEITPRETNERGCR